MESFDELTRRIGELEEENKELRKYLDDIKLYFQLLHDFFSGQYKKIPVGTIAAMVGSLLYIFLPVDLIPDCIPVVGFLDDAAVLTACLNATRFDIEEYKSQVEKIKETQKKIVKESLHNVIPLIYMDSIHI